MQGGLSRLGGVGQVAAQGLGVIAGLGAAGAAIGADVTNQMGVGHNTYPPDFSQAGRRATYAGQSDAGDRGGGEPTSDGADGDPSAPSVPSSPPDASPGDSAPSTQGDAGSFSISSPSSSSGAGRPAVPPTTSGAGGSSGAAAAGEVSASDAAVLLV